ncbi:MAG: hypothetical protein QOK16_2768 [Solirubrobacteraceae bacterium]|jgi:hypothetical protein|nr:hypothetical protein [Solirubrobacteraceae bacterium]
MATTANAAADPTQQTPTPNQYHLHARHLSVSYFPEGFDVGPTPTAGPIVLTYRDSHQALSFRKDAVSVIDVPGLGTIVTVVLVADHDQGSTTFSLLVPRVELPGAQSAPIHTEAITAIHKGFIRLTGQDQTYTVTALCGTAAIAPLPR